MSSCQFGLYPGMDLSPQLVVQLQAAGQRSESRVKAARLASGRMLSRKELTDKLSRKGIDPDTAEETADWLESLGAVDDAAYAGVIARHLCRQRVRPGAGAAGAAKAGHFPVSCGTTRSLSCPTVPAPSTAFCKRS